MLMAQSSNGFHWRTVDFVIRIAIPVLTVIMSVVLSTTLTIVIKNQEKLAEIDRRLSVIEAKTVSLPPADYRAYIDSKFSETNRRLEEVTRLLHEHMRGD